MSTFATVEQIMRENQEDIQENGCVRNNRIYLRFHFKNIIILILLLYIMTI